MLKSSHYKPRLSRPGLRAIGKKEVPELWFCKKGYSSEAEGVLTLCSIPTTLTPTPGLGETRGSPPVSCVFLLLFFDLLSHSPDLQEFILGRGGGVARVPGRPCISILVLPPEW